jgi:hypothetical protein
VTNTNLRIVLTYARGPNPLLEACRLREPKPRGKPAVPMTLTAAAQLCINREKLLDGAVRTVDRQEARIDALLKVAKRCCKCDRCGVRYEIIMRGFVCAPAWLLDNKAPKGWGFKRVKERTEHYCPECKRKVAP